MSEKAKPIWFLPQLSQEIINNDNIFNSLDSIVSDIVKDKLELTKLVENMAEVLTHTDVEIRVKGMTFLTKLLNKIPKTFLTEMQLKFMSKFYTDRAKDNHRVVPSVLEGYLHIIEMNNYNVQYCSEFLNILFRDIPCQSQGKNDRYYIYSILKTLFEKDPTSLKTMGPDLVYNVISAIDGERDPHNLYFLFSFLKHFISSFPLGHLTDNMFEVISCYYPIDFHPSPEDLAAITRQELADELAQCLTATPEFAQNCLTLLIEKLDSDLRVAKIDSLKLLIISCNTFDAESYSPFLRTLWSSIQRDINHKTDEELKMTAFEALSVLTAKLGNIPDKDKTFENFVKGIIISSQTAIAEATTIAQFTQSAKILLTVANSCSTACDFVLRITIPATISYYEFHNVPKLQVACLMFLGDLIDLAETWRLKTSLSNYLVEISKLCLTAVSESNKDYQIAGFKTLTKNLSNLEENLIPPFVEILIFNIENAQDDNLVATSVETIHSIAQKFPTTIMNLVVRDKCDRNSYNTNKHIFRKRLKLLCNLISIDEFTEELMFLMLVVIGKKDEKVVRTNDEIKEVVKNLSESISNSSLFSEAKIAKLPTGYSSIPNIINVLWNYLSSELLKNTPIAELTHGFDLISTIISALSEKEQIDHLANDKIKELVTTKPNSESQFMLLSAIWKPSRQNIFLDITVLVFNYALCLIKDSNNDILKTEACILISHIINKIPEVYMESKEFNIDRFFDNEKTNYLVLYSYVVKALMNRQMADEYFEDKLKAIISALDNAEVSEKAIEAMKVLTTETDKYFSAKYHCRISMFYTQRLFEKFLHLTKGVMYKPENYENYMLSLAYILRNIPKTVLLNAADRITTYVIESLGYDNKELLTIMTDILAILIKTNHSAIMASLQTILPRLVNLSSYQPSMDVRIKSLECLYEIGNSYSTVLLLPFKSDLLYNIASSLDDKKRLVRSMAVKARTRWFMIGAPGENN